MRIIVYHSYYGCDSGCCGHTISIANEGEMPDDLPNGDFEFDHPWGEDYLEWAKNWVCNKYGEEHVADLDWENCNVVDTC